MYSALLDRVQLHLCNTCSSNELFSPGTSPGTFTYTSIYTVQHCLASYTVPFVSVCKVSVTFGSEGKFLQKHSYFHYTSKGKGD